MSQKVHFTSTPDFCQAWEGAPYIRHVTELFHRRKQDDFVLVNSAREADIILFFEPNYYKDKAYARRLLQEQAVRDYPEKCFVMNNDPVPIGFLPGYYVGIQRPHMDYRRFRSGCYMTEPNPHCAKMAALGDTLPTRPRLLYSFRGSSRSHPVRNALFSLPKHPEAVVEEVCQWYDHSEEQHLRYLSEILESKFVLCPRGISVSSHRLFETMQLGRVPVILSDDWVPPEGVAWSDCSIRLAEARTAELPDLLASRENEAEEMGRIARQEWEKWFSPEARVQTVLKSIREIQLQRDHLEKDYQDRWLRESFYTPYGLDLRQRILKRIKTGTLAEPVLRRLPWLVQKRDKPLLSRRLGDTEV